MIRFVWIGLSLSLLLSSPNSESGESKANELGQCERVDLGNKPFIEVVIKYFFQNLRVFSGCKVVQSPTVGERAYQVTFSKETIIISKLSKPRGASALNKPEEQARLDWRGLNQTFLVMVINFAKEITEKSMEGISGTDKLSVFESSFPATSMQGIDMIPGTDKIREDGYSGFSYTTINQDHVYWTTQHEIKLPYDKQAGRNVIIYKPANSKDPKKQRPVMMQFFHLINYK